MEGTHFVFWNWTIAVYLFVAGVSAGAFAISAFAYFLGEQYRDITRTGAYIAPFPLIFGIPFLIYDLERPQLFWKLMVTLQPYSVMSLGAWLLVAFSFISFVYFYLWLPDRFDVVELAWKLLPDGDRWAILRRIKTNPLMVGLGRKNLNRLRGWVGMLGIPISLSVGIYTGMLLGVLAARPFWNSPMLPFLFLVSALKTGTASVCLASFVLKRPCSADRPRIEANRFIIHSIDFFLIILSIIALVLFLFGLYTSSESSLNAAGLLMGGEFTFLFWGIAVVVGILFPLSFAVYELMPNFVGHPPLREHNLWISGAVTLSVLAGGFILRYVIVYAGQAAQLIAA